MKETELYWVAGLLEGEGSFLIKTDSSSLKVQCAMSDFDVLQHLQSLCNGNLSAAGTKAKAHYKQIWTWSLNGEPAQRLMHDVYPLMGQRRQEQILDSLVKHAIRREQVILSRECKTVWYTEAAKAYLRHEGSYRMIEAKYGVNYVTVKNYVDKLLG
jgi:hypothetical protein